MPTKRMILIAEARQVFEQQAVLGLAAICDRLSPDISVEINWLVAGHRASDAGERLAEITGFPVTAMEIPTDTIITGELLGALVQPILLDLRPDMIALLHTTRSQDLIGGLSVAFEGACIAGVQGIRIEEDRLIFQKPVLGGKCLAEIQADWAPVIFTVLPGFFKWEAKKEQRSVVKKHRPSLPSARSKLVEVKESDSEASLSQADTVVAAGRGIGSQENLDLIDRLAAFSPKSVVAGSRIVCDAGWLPYNRQVGVTGATVTPDLYLACGISGAFQHLSGMSGSRFVVAINKDPGAAIFNAADVGVVEDLNTFLPLLIEELGGDIKGDADER